MLNQAELHELFERLALPQIGRNLVDQARMNAPVRAVQGNGGNVCHRYPSRKMNGAVIVTESRSAEFRANLQYEYDPDVLEYYAQPTELDIWLNQADSSKRCRIRTIPDFLLLKKDAIHLVEWKTEKKLRKLAEKDPSRYCHNAGGWWSPILENHLHEFGINYQLRSDAEHSSIYVQNLQFMASYLDEDCPSIRTAARVSLRAQFDGRAMVPLSELVEGASMNTTQESSSGYTTDDLYKAIADREYVVDLQEDDLGDILRTMVFRDIPALQFYRIAKEANQNEFPENIATAIEVGARVDYDGLDYLITKVNEDMVTLAREGQHFNFSIPQLECMHLDRTVTIHHLPRNGMDLATRLNALPPKALSTAIQRAKWIEMSANPREQVPRSKRTIQRYKKAVREAGDAIMDQRVALAPRYSNCGVGIQRIPDKLIELIKNVVNDKYNSPSNPSKIAGYLYFKNECAKQGIRPCCYSTFTRRMRGFVSNIKRLGKKGAYQLKPIIDYLNREDPIHGARPWQYVHIDGTELELFARGLKSMKKLGKVWLTLAIDAESRAILGFIVSFEKAGYRSIMMLLRDLVRRHNRLPETIIVDYGPEHRAHSLQRLANIYGITIAYRAKGEARFGSVIERMFGTTHTQFIRLLEGNTQLLKNPRSVSKSVQPENFTKWTLLALHGALERYFLERYGKTPHPALQGEDFPSPIEHLEHRMMETGPRRHRLVRYDQQFLIESCPGPQDGDFRVVDTQRGIQVMNFWYQSTAFHKPEIHGTKVEVRVDPWDPRFVYAVVAGHWERCVSIHAMKLRKFTARERRFAGERVRESFPDTWRDSEEGLADMVKSLDPNYWDPLLAEQQSEAARVYSPLKMTDVGCLEDLTADPPEDLLKETMDCLPGSDVLSDRNSRSIPQESSAIAYQAKEAIDDYPLI